MISVYTEITDTIGETLFYDGDCSFCTRWARRLAPVLRDRGVAVRPLPEPSNEMLLRTNDGQILGGADAAVCLARRIWWAWPLVAVSQLPGGMRLLRWGYRHVAENRYCIRGTCRMPRRSNGLMLAVLWPALALVSRSYLPAWVFMWTMTAALFLGVKWMMWRRGRPWMMTATEGAPACVAEATSARRRPGGRALPRIALGAILFWGVARWFPPLAAGWSGMIGLVLMLHFGAMAWFAPIMRAPLQSRSVGEFWGKRWNVAFPEFARPLVWEPVRRRFGANLATMAVFLVSGVLHELVISLPAGGGYGLPTGYFVLQGLAVLVERKWKLESRWFTWLVVAGPAFWLFHPLFVERVMIPFMEVLKAL